MHHRALSFSSSDLFKTHTHKKKIHCRFMVLFALYINLREHFNLVSICPNNMTIICFRFKHWNGYLQANLLNSCFEIPFEAKIKHAKWKSSFCRRIFFQGTRAGEMAQWWRVLIPAESLASVPNIHSVANNNLQLQFQGLWCPLLTFSTRHRHVCHQNTYAHMHINQLTKEEEFSSLSIKNC